jgi:orotidine-5'-phosphate decarboxylase
MKDLKPEERLVVALDHSPTPGRPQYNGGSYIEVEQKAYRLAQRLKNTGVCLKIESTLRATGYHFIEILHDEGFKVFADLKLVGNRKALQRDGQILSEVKPDILTVMCSTGISGMKALKLELPNTEIIGVTVPTGLSTSDCIESYGADLVTASERLTKLASRAYLGGIVCSAMLIPHLSLYTRPGMTMNVPDVRSDWAVIIDEDQNPDLKATPAEAIRAGADRIIVGRQITQAADPYAAAMRTIEEMVSAM